MEEIIRGIIDAIRDVIRPPQPRPVPVPVRVRRFRCAVPNCLRRMFT